jgi:RimJ/RimL family protein N-acetyltransferase
MSVFDTDIFLENERARLEPLQPHHFELLDPIAQNKEIWAFTLMKVNNTADFRKYFDEAMTEKVTGLSYPFAIYDKQENRYAGSTRFGNISLPHKRLEIGWTWYHPELQRTGLNRHCKFLLLSYCFEELGLNRVELKTSHLNNKSQTAMRKIGATEEGTFRNHLINEDGSIRHSVFFSFIKEEWPEIKARIFEGYSK